MIGRNQGYRGSHDTTEDLGDVQWILDTMLCEINITQKKLAVQSMKVINCQTIKLAN